MRKKRGSFRELKIWQKGFELLMRIYKITATYPKIERYGLVDQTNRSANAVIASIAEAHGRYYYKDKSRVLYISRGECAETQSHLSVALGLEYISMKEFNELNVEYEGLGVGINAYISSLNRET
jgi:four helix bundle protein